MRFVSTAAWLCLGTSILLFIAGVVLAERYLCGAPGPLAFLASFALGVVAILVFLVLAWMKRSWRRLLGTLALTLLVSVMLFAGQVMTLPGCSGV